MPVFQSLKNKRDELLLLRIIETLTCGTIKKDSKDMRYISVRNNKELYGVILPFFQTYYLNYGEVLISILLV